MQKIINLDKAKIISDQLKKQAKTIVLVGGCFDIFHYGHFYFLKQASKKADVLIIALESDLNVQKLKGEKRPITSQKQRATLLSAFPFVNYVLLLPQINTDQEYFNLVKKIKPAVIALSENDKQLKNKQKQAKAVQAKLVVIPQIKNISTTTLFKIINQETN